MRRQILQATREMQHFLHVTVIPVASPAVTVCVVHHTVVPHRWEGKRFSQIGRASCRERV